MACKCSKPKPRREVTEAVLAARATICKGCVQFSFGNCKIMPGVWAEQVRKVASGCPLRLW